MADSVFEFVAGELERRTDLTRLEARGTVRLALREGGLDARSVNSDEMAVVLRRVMPRQMRSRGVDDSESVCRAVLDRLAASPIQPAPDAEAPEAIFRRLADG